MRDLTRLAEETISRRIENIPGVGGVDVIGGLRREIHVLLLPDRMNALGVSPDMVVAAVQRENADVPAGRVEKGAARGPRARQGPHRGSRASSPTWSSRRAAARPSASRDVARIEDAQEEERDVAYVDGERTVAVEVRKISGGNTVADRRRGEPGDRGAEPHPARSGVELKSITDNSTWIRHSVDDVKKTLLEGGLLTILIVFLFLNSWRSTVITGLTLPVSVISAFLAVYAFGFTLNMMTLMALSLAIGILIDDAIVVRENIVRHLERGEDHFDGRPQGHERDRLRRARHLAVDPRGVHPGGVHGRHRRPHVLPVRHHRGLRRGGVAVRLVHARPDALVALVRPRRRGPRAPRLRRPPARALQRRLRPGRRALPGHHPVGARPPRPDRGHRRGLAWCSRSRCPRWASSAASSCRTRTTRRPTWTSRRRWARRWPTPRARRWRSCATSRPCPRSCTATPRSAAPRRTTRSTPGTSTSSSRPRTSASARSRSSSATCGWSCRASAA